MARVKKQIVLQFLIFGKNILRIHFNIISLKLGICIFKISPDNSETVDHETHLGATECGKNTFIPGFKSYYIYISCPRAGTVLIKFYKPSTYLGTLHVVDIQYMFTKRILTIEWRDPRGHATVWL